MEIKFSATMQGVPPAVRCPDTLAVSLRVTTGHGCLIIYAVASDCPPPYRTGSIREDVWRCINLSARECTEDWFPTRTNAEKRGGIEFRPESTSEVVFVIFLTYVWR